VKNLSALIPKSENAGYDRQRLIIFLITYLSYVGFYFTRKAFPVAKIGILSDPDISVSKEALGIIDGGYGIAYALGQFFWGICADRYGSRKVVMAGMLASVAVSIAMGLSSATILFGFLLFLQGFFQATGWAPLIKNVSNWFAVKERGRVFGLWSSNYAIGGMIASAFIGYVVLRSNWRFAFFSASAALLFIWVLFLLFQKDRPEEAGFSSPKPDCGELPATPVMGVKQERVPPPGAQSVKMLANIANAVKNPVILRLCLVYFLLKPLRYTLLFWGPLLVFEKLKTNVGVSAGISSLFEVAGVVGVYAAGAASDKLFGARRIPPIIIGFLILVPILFFFDPVTQSGSVVLLCTMLGAIGFLIFGPDSLISGVSAVDFGDKEGASAVGVINGFGSVGQVLGLSLPGIVSSLYGWDVLFKGFALCILSAALLLTPMWNARPGKAQ
jgi:OPA family sugar phosphate sensor protein UhpC-like MFS transporter